MELGKISNDPIKVFNSMMQNNPKFAEFVKQNEGKSAEQIAMDYGVDPMLLKMFIK